MAAVARDLQARAEILRRSGAFSGVPEDALLRFAAACRVRRYASGELAPEIGITRQAAE